LVVAKGQPIPIIGNSGRWRKKKGAVAVSDEIKLALQRDGFYWRRRAEHRGNNSLPSIELRRLPHVIETEERQNRRGLDPPWPVNARPGKPLPHELGILQRQLAKKQ
jgi:hypothetical protein